MDQGSGAMGGPAPSRFAQAAPQATEVSAADPRLPLIIGVTGHRDLQPESIAQVRASVRQIFLRVKNTYRDTPLLVLSPLAEGADRLVAEVALEPDIGARLIVATPMALSLYETDFATEQSLLDFRRLLDAALQVIELPPAQGVDPAHLATDSNARNQQYQAVGQYVASQAHILIALWDGQPGLVAGTGSVVELKRTGNWPSRPGGSTPSGAVAPGPVIQVTVPRAKDGSAKPAVAVREIYPESDDYEPEQALKFYHFRIFKPLDDYNREAAILRSRGQPVVSAAMEDLLGEQQFALPDRLRQELTRIAGHYATADALAGQYRAMTVGTLYRMSLIIFAAALCFDSAIHLAIGEKLATVRALLLFGCPALTLAAMLIYSRAKRRDFQNKYQDYRGLAEGLRVQFFWRLTGIDECAADHYLGRHRWELQWVRNACRSSLLAARSPLGMANEQTSAIARERWVKPQGEYFAHAVVAQERKLRRFERRIASCFWIGLVAILLLSILAVLPEEEQPALLRNLGSESVWHGAMLLLITMTAVVAAMIHNYVEKLALVHQVRMYHRMKRLYQRYSERLEKAGSGNLQADFFELGREALMENGDWVMTHRERPLEVPHH